MFRIDDARQEIAGICSALRVQQLDLIGSAVRDDFDPARSDIDVLVEFAGRDRLFDRYFELKQRLERQFGRRVDVIEDGAVKNPYVRRSIERDRLNVYAAGKL